MSVQRLDETDLVYVPWQREKTEGDHGRGQYYQVRTEGDPGYYGSQQLGDAGNRISPSPFPSISPSPSLFPSLSLSLSLLALIDIGTIVDVCRGLESNRCRP